MFTKWLPLLYYPPVSPPDSMLVCLEDVMENVTPKVGDGELMYVSSIFHHQYSTVEGSHRQPSLVSSVSDVPSELLLILKTELN